MLEIGGVEGVYVFEGAECVGLAGEEGGAGLRRAISEGDCIRRCLGCSTYAMAAKEGVVDKIAGAAGIDEDAGVVGAEKTWQDEEVGGGGSGGGGGEA